MIHRNDVNAHGIDYPVHEIRILFSARFDERCIAHILRIRLTIAPMYTVCTTHKEREGEREARMHIYNHIHAYNRDVALCRLMIFDKSITKHELKTSAHQSPCNSEMNKAVAPIN